MTMKKKILTTLSVVLILGLAALGILAYLQDEDSDVNVMTLGNVDIEQHEDFKDLADLYPGTEVKKEVTVENIGESDCYFRTLIAFEDIDSETFGINFPINEAYKWSWGAPEATIVIDGVTYQVYEALYQKALKPGETSPKSLTKVELASTSTNEDMEALGGKYEVLVLSQAVQTAGFDNAASALDEAFGIVNVENCTKWFGGLVKRVGTPEDLKKAFAEGGYVELTDDIELEKITPVEPGAEVYLNLNGKTITVDQDTKSNTLIWVKEGAKLVVDGNGTIDLEGVSTMAIFCPYGELVIENGTFKRNEVTNVTDATTGLFMGAKNSGCNVTINGGYFDPGYYDENAADIEGILAGTKTFTETEADKANRDKPGDANLVRVAIKDNVSVVLNHSGYGSFKVYGGTFVGANPAWGDEGCMLPTTPNYLRPWSYYQGALLAGQTYNENGIVIPAGYTITNEVNSEGIPVYTVKYSK